MDAMAEDRKQCTLAIPGTGEDIVELKEKVLAMMAEELNFDEVRMLDCEGDFVVSSDSEARYHLSAEEESDEEVANNTIIPVVSGREDELRTDICPPPREEPTPAPSILEIKVESIVTMLMELGGQVKALSEQVTGLAKELHDERQLKEEALRHATEENRKAKQQQQQLQQQQSQAQAQQQHHLQAKVQVQQQQQPQRERQQQHGHRNQQGVKEQTQELLDMRTLRKKDRDRERRKMQKQRQREQRRQTQEPVELVQQEAHHPEQLEAPRPCAPTPTTQQSWTEVLTSPKRGGQRNRVNPQDTGRSQDPWQSAAHPPANSAFRTGKRDILRITAAKGKTFLDMYREVPRLY
uniref:Uncharacterized protein n=1 Tax=Anopheles atroparvus TaxID=41427 RepID=A0A182IZ72_ANOAO